MVSDQQFCVSNAAAAITEQEAPAEAELDEMDRDDFAAQELVLPEAPGNPSDDSDDEGCTIALPHEWTHELSSCSGNLWPAAANAAAHGLLAHPLQCRCPCLVCLCLQAVQCDDRGRS